MRLLHPYADPAPDLDALYAQPPGVRLGMVSSLDGATSLAGRSGPLSGPADRQVLRVLRRQADVVLVGAGTARAEGYRPLRIPPEHQQRRVARGQQPVPRLAVVTRGRGLDAGSALLAPGSGLLLLAPPGMRVPGVEVAPVDGRPAALLAALRERGLERVLCEGGPTLNGTLLAAGLVDEVCATVSPLLAGGAASRMVSGAPPAPRPLTLRHLLEDGGALFGRWVGAR